ncbi:tetratricopeptide repeat-containing protein [Sphingobacterium gobiense]|uniref:Tetratricopeptide repeat-containing protein n=1 Tax=Sphingobacterium gobiense TaxID=1382456 RepID=A0A2S9JCY2_9SPHI|nr:tetratricopeptide repeat-containing protein [Sphingobacterium gobiense]PRD50706.1 tetratricopeptide repeat-containing protein [Sphingobacterium gobiense]
MKLDKKSHFYTIVGMFALGLGTTYAQMQQIDSPLDPAGYINKYNTDFEGIGPRVYVLPAPRTREELLTDSYKQKLSFQDSIDRALDLQQLIAEFKTTRAEMNVRYLLSPMPDTASAWNELVEREVGQGNYNTAYGLLHTYALLSLKEGTISQTLGLLQSALQHAQKTPNATDIAVIQYNLANIYLYDKNIQQAGYFQEAYYNTAVQQKSVIDQANSLLKIALIQAYDQDYRSAENNIIRKAIPLLNRAKAYEQKIIAWQTLARIYQLQNKHTEAQWFLIQARDLANKKNFSRELAEIEYMLASSKFVQKNYNVAKKEFLQAGELAKSEDNKLLQLAIVDKLGQIYITQRDFNNAETALHDYQDLRSEIFGNRLY